MGQKCITLKKYQSLQGDEKNEIDHVIKNNLKANSVLRLRQPKHPKHNTLWSFSWSDIIMIRTYLQQHNIMGIIQTVYNINNKTLLKADIVNLFSCYTWIMQELQHIDQAEKNELYHELTPAQKNAGVERLYRFDYAVTLDHLAGGNLLQYDAILELPYSVIFRKRVLDQVKHDIQQQYIKNQTKK